MKMRNMKRQLLLSALLSCGLLSAAAVIDDFETGVRGWGGWCDAQSEAPAFRLSPRMRRLENVRSNSRSPVPSPTAA